MKPEVLRVCGAIGLAGIVAVVLADVISWFLADGYSPVSQSISALAVGRASWLLDLGLWAFAFGCVAIGAGMLTIRHPARGWRLAGFATIAIGLETATVAMVNEYAGSRNAGANVHTWAIYLLYASFAVAALGASNRLRRISSSAGGFSRAVGWTWIVLGPIYYFWYPSGWAGAFERALAVLMLIWLGMIAALLRAEGRAPRRSP